MWQHPGNRRIEVPYDVAVAVAVLATGVADYAVISGATGLTLGEVASVDRLEDDAVRSLWKAGIPHNSYFKLIGSIRCPRCHSLIKVAPCVACNARAYVED